ncbi:MAG: ferrous iron transport protein B [Cytophagaceae bacterium]|jgi:ferrous iron transport protein B|nr:ferrous iron transport protein B [Cytophagaceae bacterium]
MPRHVIKVALLGNPNSGKSSLFNQLTGLNQKTGNFPGVTVDKKTGLCKLSNQSVAEIIDLPGTYSLYPKSLDEQVVFEVLNAPQGENYPDFLVVVVDVSNLKRNLLLFTQVRDLGFPVILALNMIDVASRQGLKVDIDKLRAELGVPVVEINARTGKGVDVLKAAISCPVHNAPETYLDFNEFAPQVQHEIKTLFKIPNNYLALQIAHRYQDMQNFSESEKNTIAGILKKNNFDSVLLQSKETVHRYEVLHQILNRVVVTQKSAEKERFSQRIDRIITHKVWGYLIFFAALFLLFQGVFSLSTLPTEWIGNLFSGLHHWLSEVLPEGPLTNLLTDGILVGFQNIVIFLPQIALLFAFISMLEESGYMTRVMYLMDKIMRQFGLNGRSVVPLISGVGCAVPALMATRSIENWKERIITIFVTPLMSCSARIPVFTAMVALLTPDKTILGIFNLHGIILMMLYLAGFLSAIVAGWVLTKLLKNKEHSYFIMEFPAYKMPRWKNVGYTIYEKSMAFVWGAGKVIIAISIVLWVLASYGPGNKMEEARSLAQQEAISLKLDGKSAENLIQARTTEASYAGYFGKAIEPVIAPIGFDWRLGISLITSFAAREVFMSTMGILYSMGDEAENEAIVEQMRADINPKTGQPFYSTAVSFSVLLFYMFALQCMSTVATVYRETKSWKWPVLQFTFMTLLAYAASFIAFQALK